jgi:hypothetical protein
LKLAQKVHKVTAAMFGNPLPICKEHLGAKIKKANQIETVDLYGYNSKTAVDFVGGFFMHVHQAMVNVVGNDLRNALIMFKTGIGAFSGAVSGNPELKILLIHYILPDMIITTQNRVTNNTMLDLKSLCSTSSAYKHAEGKFGGGVEVREKKSKKSN